MTAAYLGGTTLGGQVPVLSNAYITLLQAVTQAVATCTSLASDLATALQAIRAVAVVPLEVQYDANIDVQADLNLNLTDPVAYFSDLVAAVQAVEAALLNIPPTDFAPDLQFQLDAAIDIGLQLSTQIELIDEALAALTVIINALNALAAFLNSFLAQNLISYLTTAGAHSFIFQGNLNTFGSEANVVTPLSGFPGTSPVRMVFFFVSANDAAAVTAMNALYKVTP
jgi:hypothetical protein